MTQTQTAMRALPARLALTLAWPITQALDPTEHDHEPKLRLNINHKHNPNPNSDLDS